MPDDPRDAHDQAPRNGDAVPADEGRVREDPAGEPADSEPQAPRREDLDALAGQLVWRIGRTADDAPLTVRVGLAGSAAAFAELPRLRSASDAEVQAALDGRDVRVDWVGPRGR